MVMAKNLELRLDDQLGRGNMGAVVYRGSFGNMDVAVKSIANAYLADNEESQWEEGMLQSLNHDNVISIHHVQQNEHFRYADAFSNIITNYNNSYIILILFPFLLNDSAINTGQTS